MGKLAVQSIIALSILLGQRISLAYELNALKQPLLEMNGLGCGEYSYNYFKILKLYPNVAENLETIYCSNIVGSYSSPSPGVFSTQENRDGYVIWRNRRCKENQIEALNILKKDYPSHTINCKRYFNFENLLKERGLTYPPDAINAN